jgi:4-hydroxyproline epimerase
MQSFRVIDSHTAGEPTRTIVAGGPNLDGGDALAMDTHAKDLVAVLSGRGNGGGSSVAATSALSVAQRLEVFRTQHDHFRRAIVNEPRGSEVMVGALVVPPQNPKHYAGVIFFNNVGYLGMCGHGTIGVVETLRYLGLIEPGVRILETCVGDVTVRLHEDLRITVENVPSYRHRAKVELKIPGLPLLHADIAYGGNWFCLVECPDPTWLDRSASELVGLSQRVLAAVRLEFPDVDHVELFAPPIDPRNDSRSFVLCPGGAFDRSPCGTGTSAKLACLAADGKLQPDVTWRQESYIGSVFEAQYRWQRVGEGIIHPSITSRAFVNADVTVLVDPSDPFGWGIR